MEAPSQQDRRAQREADMQDLREKVLGSQHALAGGAPPATALDFKIATVAAANRAELMGAEDGSLAAVDTRTSAVAPQAGGAPAPPSRCVDSCSGSGWLWSYGEAPDPMAPHLLSSPSSHLSTGPYLPGRQSSMPNLVRPTSSPAGPGQLRLPRRRQSSGTVSATSSTGKCLVDMCALQSASRPSWMSCCLPACKSVCYSQAVIGFAMQGTMSGQAHAQVHGWSTKTWLAHCACLAPPAQPCGLSEQCQRIVFAAEGGLRQVTAGQ